MLTSRDFGCANYVPTPSRRGWARRTGRARLSDTEHALALIRVPHLRPTKRGFQGREHPNIPESFSALGMHPC